MLASDFSFLKAIHIKFKRPSVYEDHCTDRRFDNNDCVSLFRWS